MGHKRTIRPNAKKLSSLFMARGRMDVATFARKVKSCQRGFMGDPEEMRPGRVEFNEFPSSCICQKPFTYSNGYNENDRDQTPKQGPIFTEKKFAQRYNGNSQVVNSLQRLNIPNAREGPVSLAGDTDNKDFLQG